MGECLRLPKGTQPCRWCDFGLGRPRAQSPVEFCPTFNLDSCEVLRAKFVLVTQPLKTSTFCLCPGQLAHPRSMAKPPFLATPPPCQECPCCPLHTLAHMPLIFSLLGCLHQHTHTSRLKKYSVLITHLSQDPLQALLPFGLKCTLPPALPLHLLWSGVCSW